MFKIIALVLSLCVLALAVEQQATCSVAAIDAMITRYKATLAKFDDFTQDVGAAEVLGSIVDLTATTTPCLQKLIGYIQAQTNEPIKFFSRECPFPRTDPIWGTDPCCNNTLRYETCCVGREITVRRDIISVFKPIISECTDSPKVAALIRHFQRRYAGRNTLCDAVALKRLQVVFLAMKNMERCFKELTEGKPCENNADCASGICLPHTSTCAQSPLDLPAAGVAKCIVNFIPRHLARALQLYLRINAKTVSEADIATAITSRIYKDACLGPLGINPLLASETACNGHRSCSDGRLIGCPTGDFCGCYCATNGYCRLSLNFIQNQAQCNAFGTCDGIDLVTGRPLAPNNTDKATCESIGYCTAPSCYPNCNQAKCTQSGRCVGYPFNEDVCIKRPIFTAEGAPTCEANERAFEFGCYVPNVDATGCATAGGVWKAVPKSAAECAEYTLCREFDRNTLKKGAQCTKCGGVEFQPFKWVAGVWRPRFFSQNCAWTVRQQVQQFQWKPVFDFVKFATFVGIAFRSELYAISKSQTMCNIDPIIRLYRQFACACGDKQTGCFRDALSNEIGSFRFFSGANAEHSLGDVSIKVNDTAIAADKDSLEVKVNKRDVIVAPEATSLSRRAALQSAKRVVYVSDGKNNIGQIVSDGVALSVAPSAPITVCIKRTEEMNPVVDTSYTKAGFCEEDNSGRFMYSSVSIVSSDLNVEVCGSVGTTKSYFACFVQQGAVPGKTNTNSAIAKAVSVFGTLILMIAAVLFM